jgi:4-amino-4-deoxy-L-arabinose transferase-like glycosyltransferase
MQALTSAAEPQRSWTTTTAFRTSDLAARITSFLARHYWLTATAVLTVAAFNLTFRLGHEFVVEWDESLYGVSAWEMFENRQWIGTTFKKALDYYNTKPPLNIWLISLSFRTFGLNLIALRLPSIVSAWLTVVVLQAWVRRAVGPSVALFASLILATSFGFLYDHAGRNANTDALFALLVLLTVVTLWAADDRPWRLMWLGPVAAAAFLLRGMGVLMPLAIVTAVEIRRPVPWRPRVRPLMVAGALFVLPVAAWVWKRWQLDQWQFLGPLFFYDFVARSTRVIEGHPGSPLYHLNVLQRNQFDWLLAVIVAFCLFPFAWARIRPWLTFWRGDDHFKLVVGTWFAVTLLMPTLIRTKLSWYLNPFYPAFALLVATAFVHGLTNKETANTTRRFVLAMIVILALGVAESRLIWYSVHRRNLAQSTQGFLLAERETLTGHRVFRTRWDNSEIFVLDALVGAQAREAATPEDFLRDSTPGDYWLARRELEMPELFLVSSEKRQWLYRRTH